MPPRRSARRRASTRCRRDSIGGAIDAGQGEAMIDRRPREPVRRQTDRWRSETIERQPSGFGEREVAGWCRRRSDRRRSGVAPQTGTGNVGETAGRATDGEQRFGRDAPARRTMATRSPPRPHFDGNNTVSASAAVTAASKALPPSRNAAAPAWAASGAAAHTTPRAPRPVHCSAITGTTSHCARVATDAPNERSPVSGHGRPAWPGTRLAERARSGCGRPATGRPGLAPQHHGGPAGAEKVEPSSPSRSNPRARRQPPGRPSGEAITTSSSSGR